MKTILMWIQRHKLLSLGMVIGVFIFPLLCIYFLYLLGTVFELIHAPWSAGDLVGYVASFEAFIGTISLGALSLWQNIKLDEEHTNSLDPLLSMKLCVNNSFYILVIENTGRSVATDIKIYIEKIEDAKECIECKGPLFEKTFELYPNEIVQETVFLMGGLERTCPQLYISVLFRRKDTGKLFNYERTVVYNGNYGEKVVADVSIDDGKIVSNLDTIARASLRTANYLDGHTLKKADEADINTGRSLQNDLVKALQNEEVPIKTRTETLKRRM